MEIEMEILLRDGLWEYFNEDGSLTQTETYKNGVKQE